MKPRSNTNADFLKALAASPVAKLNQHLLNPPAIPDSSKKKQSKYNAVKVEFDNRIFDSQKECSRYIALRALLKAGEIKDLQCQVEFELNEGGSHSVKYVADFVYFLTKTGEMVVEDVKGFRTVIYRKKRKLMLEQYKIEIKEI